MIFTISLVLWQVQNVSIGIYEMPENTPVIIFPAFTRACSFSLVLAVIESLRHSFTGNLCKPGTIPYTGVS